MRRTALAAVALAVALLAGALPLTGTARAEYRAYQLEVVDLYDCRVNKRQACRTGNVTTALDPQQYLITHGGPYHIGVLLLATWMCYGDTSYYKAVCPRPLPRNPRFKVGDSVNVALVKHITEGWNGRVEVAYYQHSVRSNVYGVRFPERRNVYARYYEKDLRQIGAPGAPGAASPPAAAAATAPAAPAAAPGTAPTAPAPAAPAAAPTTPAGLAAPPATPAAPAGAAAPPQSAPPP